MATNAESQKAKRIARLNKIQTQFYKLAKKNMLLAMCGGVNCYECPLMFKQTNSGVSHIHCVLNAVMDMQNQHEQQTYSEP
jgi:hypothetical protein